MRVFFMSFFQYNISSKSIIDTRLLTVLKTGVAVAIESHTYSRGTKVSNHDLSERRALALN